MAFLIFAQRAVWAAAILARDSGEKYLFLEGAALALPAPRRVIEHEGVVYIAEKYHAFSDWKERLAPLWLPLAIDHPRTVAWMQTDYSYLGRYIFDEGRVAETANRVRRYYPQHELIIEWVENPPSAPGRWWQSASRRPWPEECPGMIVNYDTPQHESHSRLGTPCGWCGW